MSTIQTLENKSSPVNKTLRFQTKCLTGVSESVSTCLKSIRILMPVEAGNLCSAAHLLDGEELHFWHVVFQYFMEQHLLFPCRRILSVSAERVCAEQKPIGCLHQASWTWTGHYLQQENWRKEKSVHQERSFLNKQKYIYIYISGQIINRD